MVKKSLVFILIIGAFACGDLKTDTENSSLPKSSGKFGEVLVVVDTTYEKGKTGEQLEKIFYQALEGMPQQETQFRMSTVAPRDFKSILKRSRNVLKLTIGKGKKTNINIEDDVWARDQLLIQITAGSDEDAARILEKNIQTIRDYFNEKEISRLQKQYSGSPLKELSQQMKSRYKIDLTVPPGFLMMGNDEDGFWIKKEKTIGQHQVLQGISVYFYPYESDSVFTNEEMIEYRNKFTSEFIQGSRDSSYMVVYPDYNPIRQEVNLKGNYAMQYKGLWNMENDFMGGPFLHYTFVDEKNNRVVNMDAFVFAPKFNKREYLRELEAIMKTVSLQ